jgi:hypothetical protein
MRKEREDKLEPGQPTLIVTYGNTTRKHRPLDRDVTVLGRAPGCDVGLESPEVAPVHCLIVRVLDGWRLRDCSGRLGTRLNGRSAHDEVLRDDDVLQVGTFSFKLHLPAGSPSAAFAPSRQELVATPTAPSLTPAAAPATADQARAEAGLDQRQAELDRREENLAALQCDCDDRLAQLQQLEHTLANRCAALDQERAAFQAHVEKAKRELDTDRAALEKERAAGGANTAPTAAAPDMKAVPLDLERRRGELDAYAKHLLLLREGLRQQKAELEKAYQEYHAERTGADKYDREQAERFEQWRQEQEAAAREYEWRRETLAKEMAELREQRTQVVRLLSELREVRRGTADVSA